MRHRTSGPYARAVFGSSVAAATQRTAGSAAFTAAVRSAVKVAIPQRRGTAEATKAMRTRPFCGVGASLLGKAISRGRTPPWIATFSDRAGNVPLEAYFRDIGRSALRQAVNPPRRLATVRPAASRMLAARLERIPPAQYMTT